MGFSNEWDEAYKENLQMSIWPWSDLISYVMRYVCPTEPNFYVLELGCGAGANIPFFNSLGVEYFALEGSETIVNILKEKYPDLKNNIIVGDFTKHIPFDNKFDLIVDRGSITHNTTSAIKQTIKYIYDLLKLGGKFIGIDWFSTEYTEYKKGESVSNDIFSRTNYNDGNLANLGIVHFSNKEHILNLFKKFEIKLMEHKVIKKEVPEEDDLFATWNFYAIKK